MRKRYFKIRALHIIVFFILYLLYFWYCTLGTLKYFNTYIKFFKKEEINNERMLQNIRLNILRNSKLFLNEHICRIPTLDVNSPDIKMVLKSEPIIICDSKKDWVEVDGSTAKISAWATNTFGHIHCSFTDVMRKNDFEQYKGETTKISTKYNFKRSDVVTAHCVGNEQTWKKVLLGVRSVQDILRRTGWDKVPKDSLKLNVLILGFNSLSHNMWKRKLPKTYNYAIQNLKGIALRGYNIIGNDTPQALIPILTGKTELELPETRKGMRNSKYVNVYPFIWNEYQKNGYATLYAEDKTKKGTFTNTFKGFNEQPTDHYIRPFFIESSPSFDPKMHCYGEFNHMDIPIKYIKDMYKTYEDKPKFIFAFHSTYTHDSLDYASTADEGTVNFLREFHEKGLFNDTLLMLMSDRGSRFEYFRSTRQNKQEERLPGFIFVFPTWFKHKHPKAYANFKLNANRLTTPFDIHEVLKNVLHFEGVGVGKLGNRGISLFKEVPFFRTCLDASIKPEWCACRNWKDVPTVTPKVVKASFYLVDFINNITSNHRDVCAQLKLKKIISSAILIPNNHLLTLKKSESNEFLGFWLNDSSITTETYQTKILLKPGDMLFKADVEYLIRESKFVTMEKEISRLDAYKTIDIRNNTIECIEDKDTHVREYCYCRQA